MRDHQSSSPAVILHQLPFSAGSQDRAHRFIVWLPALLAWCALTASTATALSRGIPGSPDACVIQKSTPPQAGDLPHDDGLDADLLFQEKLPTTEVKDDPAKTAVPAARREDHSLASRFGLGFHASTLGLGAVAGFRVARPLNVRVGFNTFHYARTLSSDGVPYTGALYLQSLETVADWFPFARSSFHVGSGVLFFNGNRVSAVSTPPVGQVLTAGAEAYISDPQNPISGSAKSSTRRIAPMVVMGFGNLVPRHHHFGYSVDFGVVFQGAPKSAFTVAGGACDPSGEFCARAAEDSSIQAEAQSARADLAHHVSFMKYYPVVSMEFGYRF